MAAPTSPSEPDIGQSGSTHTLAAERDGGVVRRTVLPGGLRVITEAMPAVRSVAFGIWVGVGSRDERTSLGGASHFLEHLLFKGTRRRDALAIAAAMDAVGGEMNAFTAKEFTCYYARVLDTDLPLAVDVVSDMVTSSVLRSADVEAERGVILDEIAMHDDDPGDAVHDFFAEAVFGSSPLGRPVSGTSETINALSRSSIAGYYRRRYTAPAMVVAVAGNVDHDRVVGLVREAFTAGGLLAESEVAPAAIRAAGTAGRDRFTGGTRVTHRPTEQANLILGTVGISRQDERRFALGVLNNALGGGMSSRLFQEVRERRGLAYSVFSYAPQYADTGLFGVYAGCQPGKTAEVLDICREQLEGVRDTGITEDELSRSKGQVKGSLVLGLEDTGSRMSRIGKSELVYGELLTVDELIARIDSVTLDDVQAVALDLLSQPLGLAAIGPFDADHDFSSAVA